MPVEHRVVELVAEGLEAGIAGRFALLHAARQQVLRRGDKFLPADEHLLQEPRATGHRVVDQQVVLVVRLLHDQQLQIVRPHVEQPGGRRPQGLPDVDALGFILDGMELQHVHVGLDRQGQRATSLPHRSL